MKKTLARPPTSRCARLRPTRDGGLVSCPIAASWTVGLRLREYRDGDYVDYFLDQYRVCNACRCRLTLQDVVTDSVFSRAFQQVTSRGHGPPKRKLTKLVFLHIRLGFESGG